MAAGQAAVMVVEAMGAETVAETAVVERVVATAAAAMVVAMGGGGGGG